MSETEKKSRRRKERGLNVRVVQEQKEKKTDDVRVNTRDKKVRSRSKNSKKPTENNPEIEIEIDTKKTNLLEEEIREEALKEEPNKDIEKEFEGEVEWKTEEKTEEKLEEETTKKTDKESAKKIEEEAKNTAEYFETLNLHTDTAKTESKVIPRDVAKEAPVLESAIAKEATKSESKEESTPVTTAKKHETSKKPTAKELKEQEIKKAVNMATRLPQSAKKSTRRSRVSKNFGMARVALAIACLSTAVFAIVYFLNLNSSDISLRVAAMQSGIEAVYPSYTPRGYTLADVTSASGKVTMKFKSDNSSYTLIEEQTNWNSDGLLSNFVKPTYGDEYTAVSEQGLTIYMGDRWAAWVNGGMFYRLIVDSGGLTKKQIKAIATSL